MAHFVQCNHMTSNHGTANLPWYSLGIDFPNSTRVYQTGKNSQMKVSMRVVHQQPSVVGGECLETKYQENPDIFIYDTSGPFGDPTLNINSAVGIAKIREGWIAERCDSDVIHKTDSYSSPVPMVAASSVAFSGRKEVRKAFNGQCVTQLHYARKGIVTREMEYIALRENMSRSIGDKTPDKKTKSKTTDSHIPDIITGEYVRHEVASGRAVIPANINHPELEPMIIGRNFLVKVNVTIGDTVRQSSITKDVGSLIWSTRWGADIVSDISSGTNIKERREWIIRNSPIPVGTTPLYQALESVGGNVKNLSWSTFEKTLREQAELGVDYMIIHPGVIKPLIPVIQEQFTGIISREQEIMTRWMLSHDNENFLYVNFEKICQICAEYDVTLSLGNGLRSEPMVKDDDGAPMHELKVLAELTQVAWKYNIQVMIESPGNTPMDLIKERLQQQTLLFHGAPLYALGPFIADIAPGYLHITDSIAAAQNATHGCSLLCFQASMQQVDVKDRDYIKQGLVAYKIAAHTANLVKKHPAAKLLDNALSKARLELRWQDQFNLSLDPDTARRNHDI